MANWTNDFIYNKTTWTSKELAPHCMRVAPLRWKDERSCINQISQIANKLGCMDINGNKQNRHYNQQDAKKIVDEALEWQKKEDEKRIAAEKERKQDSNKIQNLEIPSLFDIANEITELREYIEALAIRVLDLEAKLGGDK